MSYLPNPFPRESLTHRDPFYHEGPWRRSCFGYKTIHSSRNEEYFYHRDVKLYILVVAANFDDFLKFIHCHPITKQRDFYANTDVQFLGICRMSQVRTTEAFNSVLRTDSGDFDVWVEQVKNNKRSPNIPPKPVRPVVLYEESEIVPCQFWDFHLDE